MEWHVLSHDLKYPSSILPLHIPHQCAYICFAPFFNCITSHICLLRAPAVTGRQSSLCIPFALQSSKASIPSQNGKRNKTMPNPFIILQLVVAAKLLCTTSFALFPFHSRRTRHETGWNRISIMLLLYVKKTNYVLAIQCQRGQTCFDRGIWGEGV